jgi:hypothetical protein
MAEGEDEELVTVVIDEICQQILAVSAGTEDAPSLLGSPRAAE